MSNDTDTTQHDSTPSQVVIERRVEVPIEDHRSRLGPFVAGVVATVAAIALGIAVFLAVSDSDDDGNIELDVPAVELDVQE